MSRRFWAVVILGAGFGLARFSEAFLVLRANGLGLSPTLAPLVLIAVNVVFAAVSFPAGALSDSKGARPPMLAGLAVLALAHGLLAVARTPAQALFGAAVWGAHMGLTQGVFGKLIADSTQKELRGTAFGIFNLVSGLSLLVASSLAGVLWSAFGPQATFAVGCGIALATASGAALGIK